MSGSKKRKAVVWGSVGFLAVGALSVFANVGSIVSALLDVIDHWSSGSQSDRAAPDASAEHTDAGRVPAADSGTDGSAPEGGTFTARPEGMLPIPHGTFQMGSTDEDTKQAREECLTQADRRACEPHFFEREVPQKTVEVPAFWMDRYEVTNKQFADWVNSISQELAWHLARFAGKPVYSIVARPVPEQPWLAVDWPEATEHPGLARVADSENVMVAPRSGFERKPAVFVAWTAADQYCRSHGSTLPSSQQWEYAARGPTLPGKKPNAYPWGQASPSCDRTPFLGCKNAELATVGEFEADKAWSGINDLGGSVSEWTGTEFLRPRQHDGDSGACSGKTPGARCHVIRGGAWNLDAFFMRVAGRSRAPDDALAHNVGFRCVRAVSAH